MAAGQTAEPTLLRTLPILEGTTAGVLGTSSRRKAVVTRDKKLRISELDKDGALREITVPNPNVDLAIMSVDGRWVLTGDHEGHVVVWDCESGKAQLDIRMPRYPSAAAFSRDGKRLAVAPGGGPIQVLDLSDSRKLWESAPAAGGTWAVVFSRDGSRLATADADTVVRIYDGHTGKQIAENRDLLLMTLALDFSADGKQLIAAGADKVIVFLDAASGKIVRRSPKLAEPVSWLEASPDGKLVATVLMNAENLRMPAPIMVWSVASGEKQQEWLPSSLPVGTGWTKDGHLVSATATKDSLQLWQVR